MDYVLSGERRCNTNATLICLGYFYLLLVCTIMQTFGEKNLQGRIHKGPVCNPVSWVWDWKHHVICKILCGESVNTVT